MHIVVRCLLMVFTAAVAFPVVMDADSSRESARSEVRLQLGDLLFTDDRFWEAIPAYARAKKGANPEQLQRASAGLLRSFLKVAEFTRAYQEGLLLRDSQPADPELRALYADSLWASGLFEEAEEVYRDVVAKHPNSPRGRHGLGRSLAARNDLEAALAEVQAVSGIAPEYQHTLGTIYRRLRRYEDAAKAFERYLEQLPSVRQIEKAEWVRSEIRFLRSFGSNLPLALEDGLEDQVHTIPFRLINDKVVVRGHVNGHRMIDLVVDTGAEQMVLSEETADAFDVEPITNTLSAGVGEVGFRGLELGRVDELEIGTLKIRNLPTLIKNPPLTGLPSRRVPDSISPIAFGLSAVIDYKNHHLIMARHLPDESADIELPMRINRLAMVRGVINQEYPKSFVVDTGGEVISISLSTANMLGMVPMRHVPLRVYGSSGWDEGAYLLPGVHLAFNQIKYENFSVVVLNLHRPSALLGFNIGGIVGHKFLSNYRVVFDMDRSVLRLTRL